MKVFNRNQLTQSISMALVGSVVAVTIVTPVQAQDEEERGQGEPEELPGFGPKSERQQREATQPGYFQPLPAPLIIAKGPTGQPKQSTISWFTSSWLATPSSTTRPASRNIAA